MGVLEHALRRESVQDQLTQSRSRLRLQSIHSVALWQFFMATFVVFPKIAIFVLVGSRLASLSDGEQRSHMDTSRCTALSPYGALHACHSNEDPEHLHLRRRCFDHCSRELVSFRSSPPQLNTNISQGHIPRHAQGDPAPAGRAAGDRRARRRSYRGGRRGRAASRSSPCIQRQVRWFICLKCTAL